MIKDALSTLKEDIVSKVDHEVRAALTLQTDELMRDLGALRAVKTTVETCHANISDNGVFMSEILETITKSGSEVIKVLTNISPQLSVAKANQDGITLARSQLSSISALIAENLKVFFIIFLTFHNFITLSFVTLI